MAQFWGFWLKGSIDIVNLCLRIGTNNKTCFGLVQGQLRVINWLRFRPVMAHV